MDVIFALARVNMPSMVRIRHSFFTIFWLIILQLHKSYVNDVGEWFVQTGGSIAYVEGVGGEMFFVKTDHGVLSGLSGSWSSGQSLEWHASATYSWYFLDPMDLP